MPETMTANPAEKIATFKIHSNGAVKAITRKNAATGADEYFVEGIASSNVRDRHGDTITAQAQTQMLEQAKGLVMFLNHSYDVPEDVFGTCEESGLETHGDIVDLVIRCRVAQTNPRAMKSWQLIKQDEITLGFSIGGNLTEYSVDEENDDGSSWCPPLIVDGIDLFEISLCGVPANPRSYTRDFVSQIARGFMRSAARSPEVRELVRKTLLSNGKPDPEIAKLLDATNDGGASGEAKTGIFLEVGDAVSVILRRGEDVLRTVHLDEPPESLPANVVTLAVPDGFDVDAFRKAWDEALANGDAPVLTTDTTRSAEVTFKSGERSISVTAHGPDATDVVASIRAQLETGAETALEQQVSARDALLAEIAIASQERDAIKAESVALLENLAEIKATPTGRQTKTATSGGSSGSTAILGVDPSTLNAEELRALHQRLARGELATDAREHAQQ